MFGRTSLLKATALALPFSLAAAAAHAASIAETVQQHEDLSTFAKAITAAKLDQQLSAEGPYTLFAPTDQAFEQLPEGALEELLKQENQAQLTSLLEQHIVDGKAISAKEMLGQQSRIDAMSGDALTVDGTSQVVLLMPAQDDGQVGGQQAAASTPTAQGSDMPMTEHQQQALESQPAQDQRQTAAQGTADMPSTEHQRQVLQDQAAQGQGQQAQGQGQMQGQEGQQTAASTPTAQGSDMPMSPHQQQALESQPAQGQRQTAAQGTAEMPSTEHQQQVLQDQSGQGQGQAQGQQQAHGQMQGKGQEGQQAGAQTTTAQGSDMPMSPHQQQAIESQPAPDQRQTAAQGTADMPSTEHQQQVLQDQPGQGEGQAQGQQQAQGEGKSDLLREASVIGADIQADNGVIHVIDAVLLPQEVLKMLEAAKQG